VALALDTPERVPAGLRRAGTVPAVSDTTHHVYFDGGVQSLGFEPDGPRATVGIIQPGEYHFDTGAPERMTVVAGTLEVLLAGTGDWQTHPQGATFTVPGDSGFDVRVHAPSAYFCEFL
jgi:uncharacterized protein YaiE (UPF0345 family)